MVRRTFRVQVLGRALMLLDALVAGPASAQELARTTGIARSTAFRLLADLEQAGFVIHGADGRFRLGLRLLQLGSVVQSQNPLADIARDLLEDLRDSTELTVTLVIRQGLDSVCIERLESPHAIRFSIAVGRHLPLHAGAQGKVLLAYAPASIQLEVLSGSMPRLAEGTIRSPRILRSELQRIRARGVAVSDGEVDDGARGVATGVFDATGGLMAAIGVAGPTAQIRFTDGDLLAKLRATAAQISARLGHDATASKPAT